MQATLFFDESETNTLVRVFAEPSERLLLQNGDPTERNETQKRRSTLITNGNEASTMNGDAPTAIQGGEAGGTGLGEDTDTTPEARYLYKTFECTGSMSLPELEATLTWWLDDGLTARASATSPSASPAAVASPTVHLLLVNNATSGEKTRSAQSRQMTVQLPMPHASELLTCGVTKLARGGNYVAVAWLSTAMEAGAVRVVLQRDADAYGTLMMTAEGGSITSPPVHAIARAAAATAYGSGAVGKGSLASSFLALAGGGESGKAGDAATAAAHHSGNALVPFLANSTAAEQASASSSWTSPSMPRCGPGASACVLAEIPTVDAGDKWERYDTLQPDFNRRPNHATQRAGAGVGGTNTALVAAMFVVTDGVAVWRVKLLENGTTSHVQLKDTVRKEQIGVLCAQLNQAANRQGYGNRTSHLPGKGVMFSELSNLQRVTRKRQVGASGTTAAAAGSSGADEGSELTFDSMHAHEDDDTGAAASGSPSVVGPGASTSSAEPPKGWLTRFLGHVGKDSLGLGGGGGHASSAAARLPSPPLGRRFLSVSAVQQSPYVAVLRWNGLVEFYNSDLGSVEHVPTCYIPPQELAPSAGLFDMSSTEGKKGERIRGGSGSAGVVVVQQWASLHLATNAIHYFASLGTLEGRRCVWARVPAVDRSVDEKVVLRCAYGIVPPASGSAPMSCSVNAREELAVLWDVGVEEDAHLLSARSLGSLFNLSATPVSAALQVVKGSLGAEEAWVWRQTNTFACHTSGRLRALVSEGPHFILWEKARGMHRAYVLQSLVPTPTHFRGGTDVVTALVESVRMDVSDEPENESGVMPFSSYHNGTSGSYGLGADTAVLQCVVTDSLGVGGAAGSGGSALRALRLVPITTSDWASELMDHCVDDADGCDPDGNLALRYFTEGCDTLQSCLHGAGLLSELLRDALTSSFTGQQLMPALSRILHEAHLAGHTPSRLDEDPCAMRASILAALVEASTVHAGAKAANVNAEEEEGANSAASGTSPFCSFGRPYILSAVLRGLLNRITFLVVTLVGVSSSRHRVISTVGTEASALTQGIAVHATPVSKDGSVVALVRAIQLTVAAYHAAQIAGPELARFAAASPAPSRAYRSGDEIVDAILRRLLYRPSRDAGASSSAAFFVIQVASGLYRCRSPRTVKASAAWAAQLQHHFPVLTHFRLLVDIDAGRTTRSTQQQDMCMKVVRSLASLGESLPSVGDADEAAMLLRMLPAYCLLDEGFLVADAPHVSALARLLVPGSLGAEEVRAWATARASLAPKLYAVGILRRLIPTLNSTYTTVGPANAPPSASSPSSAALPYQQPQQRHAAVSATTVRHYYLTELSQVRATVLAMHAAAAATEAPRKEGSANAAATIGTAPSVGTSGEGFTRTWDGLKTALNELLLDALLYLAQCDVSTHDFHACWHDMEEALELATEMDVLPFYADVFHAILSKVVEHACASQSNLDQLVSTSSTTYAAVCLEELLVSKWYNVIARMPTKSASDATEALRYRAIMGLHRYLMSRHAYAQCGRVMSDLASLLRCSPLRRTTGGSTIAVGELASLALAAVELIAPVAPVEEGINDCSLAGTRDDEEAGNDAASEMDARALAQGSPISAGFAWRAPQSIRRPALALGGSPLSGTMNNVSSAFPGSGGIGNGAGFASTLRLLSRDDLPWLRRRVYQAHCERLLWRRGSTLDCTDIWIDGAPVEDYLAGVKKLTEALEREELWAEAYRFATLADVDAVPVLQHWAVHLTRRTRRLSSPGALANLARNANALTAMDNESEEVYDEWRQIVEYCEEQSALDNQFAGFSRVLREALTTDYENTAPELREAHRQADPYTAAATLLQVFTILRERLSKSQLRKEGAIQRDNSEEEEGEDEEGDMDSDADSATTRAELKDRREALSWLPWAHAAQICTEVLQQALHYEDGAPTPRALDVFTAGVVDPLARYGRQELPKASPRVKAIVAERHNIQLDAVASAFTRSITAI